MSKGFTVIEIPVLRRRTIPLEIYDVSLADVKRFAELFCRVWDTLNFYVRRKLLKTWRGTRRLIAGYPRIILASKHRWHSQFSKGKTNTPAAFYKMDTGFCFCADFVLCRSDGYAEAVIAHELLHEFQVAIGIFYTLPETEIEADCNHWVKMFGFEAELLHGYKQKF